MKKLIFLLLVIVCVTANAQVNKRTGLLIDTLTTTELNALNNKFKVSGSLFYDDNLKSFVTYKNGGWISLGSGTGDQNASEVAILDTAENLVATDVEGALSEISSEWVKSIGYTSSPTSSFFTSNYGDGTSISFVIDGDKIDYSDALSGFDNFTPTNNKIYGALKGIDDALGSISVGSGADSGQGMSTQTLTDVTDTFDNADITVGGVSGAKRMMTKFTGTNLITLGSDITIENQPALLYHDSGVGSTTIKKGVGTTFKVADLGILADDGLIFDNYGNMTIIALANNEYLISCSSCDPYTEASAIQTSAPLYDWNAENATIGNFTTLANTGSGTITTASIDSGNPTVIDEGGNKAFLFDGDDAISLGTPTDFDINVSSDNSTILIVFGDLIATGVTIFSDRSVDRNFNIGMSGTTSILYQVGNAQNFNTGLTITGGSVYELNTSGGNTTTYLDGTLLNTVSTGVDTALNEFVLGSRQDQTNYYNNGSIRRVLYYNRVLTSQERADILAELQTVNN